MITLTSNLNFVSVVGVRVEQFGHVPNNKNDNS